MAAAASPGAQKELLLAAGIHKQVGWNWQIEVSLGEFQGVSVDDTGLVVGLDFSEQKELEFDLAVFAERRASYDRQGRRRRAGHGAAMSEWEG